RTMPGRTRQAKRKTERRPVDTRRADDRRSVSRNRPLGWWVRVLPTSEGRVNVSATYDRCREAPTSRKTSKVRTAFFGTPEIALPALTALHETTQVVGVVCQPDRPR